MRLGKKPKIFFDNQLESSGNFAEVTDSALHSSALLLVIFSPAFVSSELCRKELQQFVDIAEVNRIIKVVKLPANGLSVLDELLGFDFFGTTADGIPSELTGEKYLEALGGLAHQVALLLRGMALSDAQEISRESRMEVFLCHSSADKPAVRELWKRLKSNGFDPWLDEKEILPGQRWDPEIRKAIDRAGSIIVFLSEGSVSKEGYLQREIRMVLDKASEMPDDTIFLIPARLENCPVPVRLKDLQWVDLFSESGYGKLVQALEIRANAISHRKIH